MEKILSTVLAHVQKYMRTHAYAHRAYARAYCDTHVRIVHTHGTHVHTHTKVVRMHVRTHVPMHAYARMYTHPVLSL